MRAPLDVLAEALGQADAADVEADADVRADDLKLGRAAADVDDERARLDRADPAQRQLQPPPRRVSRRVVKP